MVDQITHYNSEQIEMLLRNIIPSQEGIVEAATVFLNLGRDGYHHKLTIDWETMFRYFSGPDHSIKRQSLLYLTNDILQKCRQKDSHVPQFLADFKPVLIEAIRLMGETKDSKNLQTAKQLIGIWKQRKVLNKDQIRELEVAIEEAY